MFDDEGVVQEVEEEKIAQWKEDLDDMTRSHNEASEEQTAQDTRACFKTLCAHRRCACGDR